MHLLTTRHAPDPGQDLTAVARMKGEMAFAQLMQPGERMEDFLRRTHRSATMSMYACAAILDHLVYKADDQLRRSEADKSDADRAEFLRYFELFNDRLNQASLVSEDLLCDFKLKFCELVRPQLTEYVARAMEQCIRAELSHPASACRILSAALFARCTILLWTRFTDTVKRLPINVPDYVPRALFFLELMVKRAGNLSDIYAPLSECTLEMGRASGKLEEALFDLVITTQDNRPVVEAMRYAYRENGIDPDTVMGKD